MCNSPSGIPNHNNRLIFVTGYFGAPILEIAEDIARQEGMDLLILDRAIEKKDGRSIRKICMAGGEHGYRNLECEAVQELSTRPESARGLVVACGDGILYDEMTRDLILEHELIIAGEDMSLSKLWKGALEDQKTWHAFMLFGSEEEKRRSFEKYHERQRELFRQVRSLQDSSK